MVRRPRNCELLALEALSRQLYAIKHGFDAERLARRRDADERNGLWLGSTLFDVSRRSQANRSTAPRRRTSVG